MDLQQLCGVLHACLGTDHAQRSAAEAALKQLESTPGQTANLLRVAAEDSVDPAVRQVAAISFKNLVKRSWQPKEDDTTTFRLPEAEKQMVKEHLLEGLIRAPHSVQVQLGEVLKIIVYCDYPERWPGLLPALTANLVAPDPVRVHGGLFALRILTKKYEFSDPDERGALVEIINTTLPVLLNILRQLLASPPTPEVCLYTKLVFKTFWSATYMEVPAKLLEPEQFSGWMSAILTAANQVLPEEQQPPRRDDRPATPWWKSRKWVYHIVYRLLSRYGNPKHCKQGNDVAFATMFERDCSITFLDAMLGRVSALTRGEYLSPRVVNLIFQYLTLCLPSKHLYKHIADHWDDILANVAFPLMCFSDEDAQLWVEDPHEYVRKGYDILEDMYSPKTAVANFGNDLCQKKKHHLDKFLGHIVTILQQFHTSAAAGQVDATLVRRMDGALLAIGVLSDMLKKKKPYKHQVGSMLVNFVVPCFTCPYGHLRAKAVWVAGTFSDVAFPDGQGCGASFNALFEKAVGLLTDPELPVRVDTVIALRSFIDAAEDTDSLKPLLPTLLNHIFNLMNEIDSEDLVHSLEALVEKFGPDIAPYAAQMVQQLTAAFDKYTADDHEDEDEDDMASFAAYGCLRAINTLLESVSSLGGELYPVMEASLYPLMYKLISTDGQDVIEEALEILAYMTFYGPGITPALWSLWPRMHAMLLEWGIDYWENLLVPLDNMITRDTATFLSSKEPDYLTSTFQMVQHSLTGDFNDRDVVSAARLLEVVLMTCRGHVDAWVQPYISVALQRLPRTESGSLKDALVLVVANALYYNPVLTMQTLAAMNAVSSFFSTWFSMITTNRSSGKMKYFRRLHDKKVCLLGLSCVISLPEASLPAEVLASQGLLLMGATRVLSAFKEQKAEIEAAQGESDDDDEDEGQEEEEDDGHLDGGDDKEEEDEEEAADEYLKRLERQAKSLFNNNDDDSDDEFTDDEELQTPIDNIDPFVFLADTLAGVAASQPTKHQALQAAVAADPAAQANLQALLAHAEVQRQALAKKAAEA